MTDEELEQKARLYEFSIDYADEDGCYSAKQIEQSFIDGYKLGQVEEHIICGDDLHRAYREIEELKSQIKPLEDRICTLRRKNASLENKVEKMKCCENCACQCTPVRQKKMY